MQNMIDKARNGFSGIHVIGVDLAAPEGDYSAELTLMLNSARSDERANRAEVFAARLEAIACFFTKNELTGVEAAEALRTEATRIRNEAGEIH